MFCLLILLIIWLLWSNLTIGITRHEITSDRLPAAFDGCRIVQLADLHNCEFGKDNSTLLEQVKAEKPDYIVLTGDQVDCRNTDIPKALSLIRRLTEIAPCYCVTGNHEAWISNYEDYEQQLRETGVHVMGTSFVLLERGGETIQLLGVDDPFLSVEQNMRLVIENSGINSEKFTVMLSHRPDRFDAYAAEGIDLALTGHTHGGQARLPWIGAVYVPMMGWFPRYDAGVFTEGRTTMIVSRGIGNSSIPVRVNDRPEIISVTLRCAGSSK